MGNLPFERMDRVILTRQSLKTSDRFGEDPFTRPIKELLDYGIVNIDKPSGPTSHQVSAFVQKILKINKSGHSGTLDPKVTGCLPVALGRGTRVVQSLLTAGKEYVCLMHIHDEFDESKLRQVIEEKFTGKIKQLPPIKSAVKRQHRYRKIYYFEILEVKGQDVLFVVGTQAGTYIRKLCFHPSAEIITDTGQVSVKDFNKKPEKIYTMDRSLVKKSNPSETQEFKFEGNLLKFNMDSGVSFLVTPEHKMLVSTSKGYAMKPAFAITKNDYIVKSLKPFLPEIEPIVSDLLDDGYLVNQPDIKKLVKNAFIKKFGSIRAMNRMVGFDRKPFLENSPYAITIKHVKESGIYERVKNKIYDFKTEKGTEINCSKITRKMAYLLGLLASDGNNTKEKRTVRRTRLKFHNTQQELVDKFISYYTECFPSVPITKKRVRNLWELDTSNSFFASIASSLGIKSPQKNSDIKPLLTFPKNLIIPFLRGYFDGDGTAYYKKYNNRQYTKISIFSVNFVDAKRIHQLLLKLGIYSKIFKKKNIYDVSIKDIYSKKRFISLIGTNHPRKKLVFEKIMDLPDQNSNDSLYVGLHYKEELRKNKSKLRSLGGNINRVLNSSIPLTRGLYKRAMNLVELSSLDYFQIERIKSIESVPYKGYVYDMTVPKTHNFLIETGFVSSNCHDIGLALGSGAHMAELRRTKAGPFNEKTLCTLQDLTDAMHYFEENKDETKLRELIRPIEVAVDHLPKVWIADTTVNALCNGATLKVPGIVKLESEIQVDDPVAVMTLKGELVAVGRSLMTSKQMVEEVKGIAVRSEQVLMKPGIYPKIDKP